MLVEEILERPNCVEYEENYNHHHDEMAFQGQSITNERMFSIDIVRIDIEMAAVEGTANQLHQLFYHFPVFCPDYIALQGQCVTNQIVYNIGYRNGSSHFK